GPTAPTGRGRRRGRRRGRPWPCARAPGSARRPAAPTASAEPADRSRRPPLALGLDGARLELGDACLSLAAGDDAGAAGGGDGDGSPIEEDDEAVARTAQVEDVQAEPGEPRERAAQLHAEAVDDGGAPADDRHLALVEVRERARLAARLGGDD